MFPQKSEQLKIKIQFPCPKWRLEPIHNFKIAPLALITDAVGYLH